jgi:hypothetical protein
MTKTSRMNVAATFERIARSSFFLMLGEGDGLQETPQVGGPGNRYLRAVAGRRGW